MKSPRICLPNGRGIRVEGSCLAMPFDRLNKSLETVGFPPVVFRRKAKFARNWAGNIGRLNGHSSLKREEMHQPRPPDPRLCRSGAMRHSGRCCGGRRQLCCRIATFRERQILLHRANRLLPLRSRQRATGRADEAAFQRTAEEPSFAWLWICARPIRRLPQRSGRRQKGQAQTEWHQDWSAARITWLLAAS